jgi:hypothetical protein
MRSESDPCHYGLQLTHRSCERQGAFKTVTVTLVLASSSSLTKPPCHLIHTHRPEVRVTGLFHYVTRVQYHFELPLDRVKKVVR